MYWSGWRRKWSCRRCRQPQYIQEQIKTLAFVPSTHFHLLPAGNSPPAHASWTRNSCASLYSLTAQESDNLKFSHVMGKWWPNLSNLVLSLVAQRWPRSQDSWVPWWCSWRKNEKLGVCTFTISCSVIEIDFQSKRWRSQAIKNWKARADNNLWSVRRRTGWGWLVHNNSDWGAR